jgi:hypothetical protein
MTHALRAIHAEGGDIASRQILVAPEPVDFKGTPRDLRKDLLEIGFVWSNVDHAVDQIERLLAENVGLTVGEAIVVWRLQRQLADLTVNDALRFMQERREGIRVALTERSQRRASYCPTAA